MEAMNIIRQHLERSGQWITDSRLDLIISHIQEKAREQAVNGMAIIPQDTVFEWSDEYCKQNP